MDDEILSEIKSKAICRFLYEQEGYACRVFARFEDEVTGLDRSKREILRQCITTIYRKDIGALGKALDYALEHASLLS